MMSNLTICSAHRFPDFPKTIKSICCTVRQYAKVHKYMFEDSDDDPVSVILKYLLRWL